MESAVVVSVGLYGCATWSLTKKQLDKLESCQQQLIRRMLKLKWQDKVSYLELVELADAKGITILTMKTRIYKAIIRYIGHVERMSDDRLPKQLWQGQIFLEGYRRLPGGQYKAYRDVVKEALIAFGIDVKLWKMFALDRALWRALLKAGVTTSMEKWIAEQESASMGRKAKRELIAAGAVVVGNVKRRGAVTLRKTGKARVVTSLEAAIEAEDNKFRKITGAVRVGTVSVRRGDQVRRREIKHIDEKKARPVSYTQRRVDEENALRPKLPSAPVSVFHRDMLTSIDFLELKRTITQVGRQFKKGGQPKNDKDIMRTYVRKERSTADPTLIMRAIWAMAIQVGGHWVVRMDWGEQMIKCSEAREIYNLEFIRNR